MELTDYIFIICLIIAIFSLLVTLLKKIIKIPEDMMTKSRHSSIKKGQKLGSVIGIIVGLYIGYYIIVNNYFALYDIIFG